jgi:hypothetical protein
MFKKEKQEFFNPNIVSTSTVQHSKEVSKYEMPPSLDHTKEMKPLG